MEIALITAVSVRSMFSEREKGTVSAFDKISSCSVCEKSPSGPIKTLIFLSLPKSFEISLCLEFISAKNNFVSLEMPLTKSFHLII